MKLTTWTATANGRAIWIEGTSDDGHHVELTDVAKIENDFRRGTTYAIRKKQPGEAEAERVRLS